MPSILIITSRVLGPFILQALAAQLLSPGTMPKREDIQTNKHNP